MKKFVVADTDSYSVELIIEASFSGPEEDNLLNIKNLLKEQTEIPYEFNETFNDRFWDILA